MSIANIVRLYISNKPFLREAIESGVINQSALSRSIQRSLGIKDYYAVKAAVRRHCNALGKNKLNIEKRALSVLKGNKLTLANKISVIVTERDIDSDFIAKIRIGNQYTYLLDSEKQLSKQTYAKTQRIYRNCSAITIHSGEDVENVSGVMAFVTSLFAEYEINIIELISCYTENVLVVREEDAMKGYSLLSELVR